MTAFQRFISASSFALEQGSPEDLRQQAEMDRLEVQGYFTDEGAAENARQLRRITEILDRDLIAASEE